MKKKVKTIGDKFDSLKKNKEQEAIKVYKEINRYPLPNILPYYPPKEEIFITRLSNSSKQLPTF